MGTTTFDEALNIAVRVEQASLISQTWTPLDQTIASTSSKTDALTSEVLEKVLHRLDEMELNLGKLQSKSSLHRSPSPCQHSASSYTHEHQSRPKHRHFDDQRHQPFRSFSPQRSPSPHRRFTSPAPPYNSHPRFRSPSPQRSYYINHNSNRSQSPQHYQRRPSPSRHNSDPPAHQDITPKTHRILNGTQHKTSGNPTGNLHSLTVAILTVTILTVVILITEENLPFVK